MEYFDILDENGNKTGEVKPRKEVHTKGYWHKSVYACIINSKGEILMQRRSPNKSIFPNRLDISVGGHPSSGENEIDAIVREVLEEIGVKVDVSKLEYLFTFVNKHKEKEFIDNQFLDVYLLEMDLDINKLVLQAEEVSEIKNVHYTDFEQMVNSGSEEIVSFTAGWKKLCEILHKRYD